MSLPTRIAVPLVVAWLACAPAHAATTTLSGFLNDPANAALVGSNLGAPQFGSDLDVANNVALYTLHVTVAGNVTFDSNGFAAGGGDPYFTLFSGTGAGATFLGSNFAQAFATGGDFLLDFALGVGDYTIAMGLFANLSFAENLGTGGLGDGFTGLGVPQFLGDSYYELVVTTPDEPRVPEPATLVLIGAALLALAFHRRMRASAGTRRGG